MSYVATVTVPAGKVASTLTDFVTRVDLSTMPPGWWSAITQSDGREIRVRSGGTDVPFDLVNIATAYRVGELFFKHTLTTAETVVTVEVVPGATAPAVTDPLGRNAVWSNYDEVYIGGVTSRTGTGHDLALSAGASMQPYAVTERILTNISSHQGIAKNHSDGSWIAIHTDRLRRYAADGTLALTNSTPIADSGITGANHIGDGCVVAGELVLPLCKWPLSGGLVERMSVWDAATLTYLRSYDISAVGSEFAGFCYNSDDAHFYAIQYKTAGTSAIHKFTPAGVYVSSITLSTAILNAQGITYTAGNFYVSAVAGESHGIHEVTPSGTVTQVFRSRIMYEIEGIDSDPDGTLYAHYTNSADTDSRIFTVKRAPSKWLVGADDSALAMATINLTRTSWTIGATVVSSGETGATHQTVFSYGTATNTTCAQLIDRNVSPRRHGIWNSTDGWMNDDTVAVEGGIRRRFHHTQNGTTDRKIWRDGAVRATDSAVAQRPTTGQYLAFLSDPTNATSQDHWGHGNYFYLRNGVLSADWIAAEYASWETPSGFYTVTDTSAGTMAATLPPLAANLSGGIEFSGTIMAALPTLGANLSGTSLPPGIAGDLTATLPPLGTSLAGAYSDTAALTAVLPPLSASLAGTAGPSLVVGTLTATLPVLHANIAGLAFEPGTSGFLAAVLPTLSASLSSTALGRTGLGLYLDSSAVLTVDVVLEPEPSVPPGTPATVLHIIAPTVPVPTLVAGRPQ